MFTVKLYKNCDTVQFMLEAVAVSITHITAGVSELVLIRTALLPDVEILIDADTVYNSNQANVYQRAVIQTSAGIVTQTLHYPHSFLVKLCS